MTGSLEKNNEKNHEGFVVVNRQWQRIKEKSTIYVTIHHLLTRVSFNPKSVLEKKCYFCFEISNALR